MASKKCSLANADLLLWMGDFNYRLDMWNQQRVIDDIHAERYSQLLEKDQLIQQKLMGQTFVGMKEGKIEFSPTYKFDKGSQSEVSVCLDFKF